ncbi:hypothetical protein [Nocardia sp. CDC160]|uniref:hypothetical protein n=1 Tax=Nocardia sp. CDC160 TaxID=3112166 RepID=UPI002DBD30EB|nr:hypothetical protein [Nocardia sp. CDC160]MEC3919932.1 hypothetical protein [Nocardia sp. CDC160]
MSTETNDPTIPFATLDPALHLEYLYGPQWAAVMRIVERAAQLTAEEREKMNAEAGKRMQDSMSALTGAAGGAGGLAGLLSGLGQPSQDPQPLQIASETAKEFGRSRNVQVAGLIAGQAVSGTAATSGELAGLLQSLGSIGTLTVVSQAVTAAVLSDLVGRGRYTQEVHDALMQPWTSVIS